MSLGSASDYPILVLVRLDCSGEEFYRSTTFVKIF